MTVSPLTTVIDGAGSQAAVAQALRLHTGPNALSTTRDLTTLDVGAGLRSPDPAVVADAARLASINVQLMVVAGFLGRQIVSGQVQRDDLLSGLILFGSIFAIPGGAICGRRPKCWCSSTKSGRHSIFPRTGVFAPNCSSTSSARSRASCRTWIRLGVSRSASRSTCRSRANRCREPLPRTLYGRRRRAAARPIS